MKRILYFVLSAALTLSCTQNKNSDNKTDTDSIIAKKSADITISESKSCYLDIVGKDSAKLEIERNGSSFNGFLSYKRFESDSSLGEVNGTISGDTLKGNFNFLAEGTISKSEVYFLMKNGELQEAVGEIIYENDVFIKFKNPSQLSYGESFIFKPVDCSDNFIPKADKDFYYNLRKSN